MLIEHPSQASSHAAMNTAKAVVRDQELATTYGASSRGRNFVHLSENL
jgi:hypothetical protein